MKLVYCRNKVEQEFPFKDYLNEGTHLAMDNIASTTIKYLSPGSKILDFGAGPCDISALLQCLGYQCSAYDDLLDNWHREEDNLNKILKFAKSFDVDFKLADNGYLPFEDSYFDMIMAHHVLEHLHESPRIVLNDLCKLLKPQGLLFITVPNAVNIRKRISVLLGNTNLTDFRSYYWYEGAWRGHIREYVKRDLRLLNEYLDFELVELRSYHHMLQKIPTVLRPLYRLATHAFPGWRDSWMLLARKPGPRLIKKPLI